jgi:DNA ligase-associated metallophosphoesterase
MISNSRAFNLKHQRLWLLPQKAIYWQKQNTLLVADPHIGKSGHFRKSGVAVPEEVAQSNLNKLNEMVELTEADHLIILGDLFHSDINNEWNQFINWRKNNRQLEVSLVIGNHDILETKNYHQGIINVFSKLTAGPFLFVHDVDQYQHLSESSQYILSGHIHPAVQLKGRGRQAMKFPSFYFGKEYGILPAFGSFTGTHIIEPTKDDDIFIIVDSKIISKKGLKS